MTGIPCPRPSAVPVVEIVDNAILLLLHVPPGVASLSVVEPPVQIKRLPVMAAGPDRTVIVYVAVPQMFR